MKKILVSSLIGLLGSAGVVMLDIKFVKWIFTLVPVSSYAGLIKVVIVFIDMWMTAGLCFIPFAIGIFIGTLLSQN